MNVCWEVLCGAARGNARPTARFTFMGWGDPAMAGEPPIPGTSNIQLRTLNLELQGRHRGTPTAFPSFSPGLRGTSYPGLAEIEHQPQRGCIRRPVGGCCNPVGVDGDRMAFPRVASCLATLGLVIERRWRSVSHPATSRNSVMNLCVSLFGMFSGNLNWGLNIEHRTLNLELF
jgi:hypothetical protein